MMYFRPKLKFLFENWFIPCGNGFWVDIQIVYSSAGKFLTEFLAKITNTK